MNTHNFTPLNLNKFKSSEKPPATAIVKRPSYLPQVLLGLSLLLTLGLSIYFFQQYQQSQKLLSQATLDNSGPLIELIGKLVILPSDETPTIATVTDRGQLPDQPFFKNAENGDKILVYEQAKKAYLYRPSVNKIVEIGPVYKKEEVAGAATGSAELNTSPSPTTSGKIIYNPITPTPSIYPTTTAFYPSLTPTNIP